MQAAPVVRSGLRGVTALPGEGRISLFSGDSCFCCSTPEVKMIPSALKLKFNFLSATQGTDFPLEYWQQVRNLHSKLNCFENSPDAQKQERLLCAHTQSKESPVSTQLTQSSSSYRMPAHITSPETANTAAAGGIPLNVLVAKPSSCPALPLKIPAFNLSVKNFG